MPKFVLLTTSDLKDILRAYQMDTSGTKTELIQRLQERLQTDELSISEIARVLVSSNNGVSGNNINSNIPGNSDHANTPGWDGMSLEMGQTPTTTNVMGSKFSIKEIGDTIPFFDPTNEQSIAAEHFVHQIEGALLAYGFDEKCLLLAVYAKLKGAARIWLDGQTPLFTTWEDFKTALLDEFALDLNEAEVGEKMRNATRLNDEKLVDYCFRMNALGKRYGLSEAAIIKYTRGGLRNRPLQTAIAVMKFNTMKDVRKTLVEYEQNTISISRATNGQYKEYGKQSDTGDMIKRENKTTNITCFNCNDKGHISKNCPKPQRRERCALCQKTNHKTENCYKQQRKVPENRNTINTINDFEQTFKDVVKDVRINGRQFKAFMDTGSASSLIRQSRAKYFKEISKCHRVLSGFAGGKYIATQMIVCDIELDSNSYNVTMYVVPDYNIPQDVLLGRDVLCKDGSRFVIENGKCFVENLVALTQDNENESAKGELEHLISANSKCFADSVAELGSCSTEKLTIMLKTDQPVNLKPYRIPFAKRHIVNDIVRELMDFKIIRPSNSHFASPVVLVDKKNGEHRLCVDYRSLNKITIKTPFPMPIMEEQFAQLAGNSFFTTLDLRMGYYQVEVAEESKAYTAFITTDGLYEFNRMPFGLVNAPAVFQRIMNQIVQQMGTGEALAYLDDVIIPSKTIAEGLQRLAKFFELLDNHGLTLRRDKCRFFEKQIEHLGHVVNKDGIKPGSNKVKAILNFPIPQNVTEVRRFLGLTGFFRKFVRDYAMITKPLTRLLSKQEYGAFQWTSLQQQSFEELIGKLTNAPLLTLYNVNHYHEVHTDACSIGLAGMLLQSEDERSWKPVMYFSRHCTVQEQCFHSYELETLAMVETLERFRLYLLGKRFRVITDCAAIVLTKEQRELKPRIARWWLKMQEYDFDMVHRAGNRLAHVDALSRAPVEPSEDVQPAGFVYITNLEPTDWVAAMQFNDERARTIMNVLKGRERSPEGSELNRKYVQKDQRLYRIQEGCLKLFVPKSTRWGIIKHFHDDMGHFAVEKTLSRIKSIFWFPKMRKLVKGHIQSCITCCYNKTKNTRPEGEMHSDPPEPIPFRLLHIDHLGPFVRSKRGNSYIITISDAFSKFCILKPVRNTKTTAVLNTLNEVIGYFGLPKKIVSDRGTAFTSKMFEEFCARHHIIHVKNAVRTPRANGQAERTNETILNALKCSTKDAKEWDNELIKIQWVVNSQRNNTTKHTPKASATH